MDAIGLTDRKRGMNPRPTKAATLKPGCIWESPARTVCETADGCLHENVVSSACGDPDKGIF